jgi:hypothetical protein
MDITMSKVTSLQTTCSRENIVRLFARFANKYGTLWTTRLGTNPDWEMCIDDWFNDLKHFDYKTLVLAAKAALTNFVDFPPTFGQFEDLCKKHSGFLQRDDAIKMMIARDFSHPIVKMMYDRIGSWTMTNGKETDIQSKAKEAYRDAECEFVLFPEKSWAQLESFNAKPKELTPPPKIPSTEERRGFKERMAEYQQKLEEQKESSPAKLYREFDANQVNPNPRDFDKTVYEQYRSYLISIPETETLKLPTLYGYHRLRFLASIELSKSCRRKDNNASVDANPQGMNNSSPVHVNEALKVYRNYTGD